MIIYNIVKVHPTKPMLILDDDFADYLREQSFNLDETLSDDSLIEFLELLDEYMKEES